LQKLNSVALNIFYAINDFVSTKKTILTLGTFDGVHVGHKKILERIQQQAKVENAESLVLTFFPHPRMILQENSDIKLLNTIEEKTKLLELAGMQNLVIHPFDEKFAQLTAQEFVATVLVNQFKIKKIIIGHDHRFGRNRTANIQDLIVYGKQYGFEVEQISVQEIEEVSVSSTKIRNALLLGNMSIANAYLGYAYLLTGTVVQGKQLGRTIGFPTANLKVGDSYKLIPKSGVYFVRSCIKNKTVYGLMNIGLNPTVGGTVQSIEVYYLNFDDNLYHQQIEVAVLQRIRSEIKFDSVNFLKIQLEKDKATALQLVENLR
jgi:riboflavin kinase / FMN adenylyltransferase